MQNASNQESTTNRKLYCDYKSKMLVIPADCFFIHPSEIKALLGVIVGLCQVFGPQKGTFHQLMRVAGAGP